MMKKILLMLFLIISSLSYSATNWKPKHNKKIIVIYKVLDPLIVEVDKPQKIVVPATETTFKYSDYSSSKRKLDVKVKASYTGTVDRILAKIYERVYFKLENEGKFELTHTTEKDKKISGKGYFVDAGIPETQKKTTHDKEFITNLQGNTFSASTQIDAEFTKEKDLPMGVYQGTLRLDVWFGGTFINP